MEVGVEAHIPKSNHVNCPVRGCLSPLFLAETFFAKYVMVASTEHISY